ncbi:DUF6861 domain-containing protein [Pseudomonas sp. Teo4]|uniref:DUF6861 domain-containing protein n=1 Tax=Pseudomonas sp. Teo4 TaxID=3064528 RepID=UPI002ABAA463|nr:hypothetical protein [Pseudomonas sp. Teo4]MDZ3991659.1 hypothetical protein [Pseudomonas sp. Teo4]
MDLLANIPSWGDIERNLEQKFSELNQSVDSGLNSAHDAWDGFSRRVGNGANQAYGYLGGHRIDNVRQAMTLSYPIIQDNLKRKWSSIGIEQILPVLLQLVKEVSMILGGSVAVGSLAGGVAGAFAFGVGAAPGAAAGAGIGLQVGNLILMGLGLHAIAEYFYQGLPNCLATLQQGMATAWFAEDGLKPAGLDPSGGAAAQSQDRIEQAARQLARGQEQLVLLLLTAIVTYLTRGQMKAGLMSSMDSIAARSAKLQADISNRQLAAWLAKNEQKLLAQPELQAKEVTPLKRSEPELQPLVEQAVEQPMAKGAQLLKPKYKPGFTEADILAIAKGERPDPTTYLDPDYVAQHLAQFDNGASRFMTQTNLEKYGIAQRDGTSFIMPGHEASELFANTAGDKRALEKALGLPDDFLETNTLVRVDIPDPRQLNLRIPSGNEAGANEFWIPGGKLPDGNSEAVIDAGAISAELFRTTPLF